MLPRVLELPWNFICLRSGEDEGGGVGELRRCGDIFAAALRGGEGVERGGLDRMRDGGTGPLVLDGGGELPSFPGDCSVLVWPLTGADAGMGKGNLSSDSPDLLGFLGFLEPPRLIADEDLLSSVCSSRGSSAGDFPGRLGDSVTL